MKQISQAVTLSLLYIVSSGFTPLPYHRITNNNHHVVPPIQRLPLPLHMSKLGDYNENDKKTKETTRSAPLTLNLHLPRNYHQPRLTLRGTTGISTNIHPIHRRPPPECFRLQNDILRIECEGMGSLDRRSWSTWCLPPRL